MKLTGWIDKIADELESKGYLKEAYDLDLISNTIEAFDVVKPGHERAIRREGLGKFSELPLAAEYVSKMPPNAAEQAFIGEYGPQFARKLLELVHRYRAGDKSTALFADWKRMIGQATVTPVIQAQSTDPFLPGGPVRTKATPAPSPFTRT